MDVTYMDNAGAYCPEQPLIKRYALITNCSVVLNKHLEVAWV